MDLIQFLYDRLDEIDERQKEILKRVENIERYLFNQALKKEVKNENS